VRKKKHEDENNFPCYLFNSLSRFLKCKTPYQRLETVLKRMLDMHPNVRQLASDNVIATRFPQVSSTVDNDAAFNESHRSKSLLMQMFYPAVRTRVTSIPAHSRQHMEVRPVGHRRHRIVIGCGCPRSAAG
jgi:hypothetical protein